MQARESESEHTPMTRMDDDDKVKSKAERIREAIDAVKKKKQLPKPAGQPESPRDLVHRRMAELDAEESESEGENKADDERKS